MEIASSIYEASPIKRRRATNSEMEERAEFLIDYADKHGPVTVRGLYYQANVHKVPGIGKDDAGYNKVQRQVLQLRRDGRIDYSDVADSTRWMRKPKSFNGVEEALANTARFYRKNLWAEADDYVEVWCEKNTVTGVLYPITAKYDVPLMPTGGYTSETFAFEAIEQRDDDDRDYYVYYIGDYDRSGRDAARSLKEKLERFADDRGISIIFETIGVTLEQIHALELPTRPHKRTSPADKKWPHDFACELDAIPPDYLRDMVEEVINRHLPQDKLDIYKIAEASERELLSALKLGGAHG